MHEHPVATPERVIALVAAVGATGVEIDFGGDRGGYARLVDTLDALAWLSPDCVRRIQRGEYGTPWEQLLIAGLRISSPLGFTPVSDRLAAPVERLSRLRAVDELPEGVDAASLSVTQGGIGRSTREFAPDPEPAA